MVEHVTGVQFLMLSAAGIWAMFSGCCGCMLCLRHAGMMWIEILCTAVKPAGKWDTDQRRADKQTASCIFWRDQSEDGVNLWFLDRSIADRTSLACRLSWRFCLRGAGESHSIYLSAVVWVVRVTWAKVWLISESLLQEASASTFLCTEFDPPVVLQHLTFSHCPFSSHQHSRQERVGWRQMTGCGQLFEGIRPKRKRIRRNSISTRIHSWAQLNLLFPVWHVRLQLHNQTTNISTTQQVKTSLKKHLLRVTLVCVTSSPMKQG